MKNFQKYSKRYFLPSEECFDWVKKDAIETAPIWCSVDLRDGNQALSEPMNLYTKLEFFRLLTEIGFKEIEIGFPAASETEFAFVRKLIEENLIPDDVTVQVITQAREHIVRRTFDAIHGAKNVIVHIYTSVSPAQREQVLKGGKAEAKRIAVDGAKLFKEFSQKEKGTVRFEFSPESFTSTEPEYALEVCDAVLDVVRPTPENKVIINLPSTVETSMPHVFAEQVEYMKKNLDRAYPNGTILSLHTHNDRGCGVAAAEAGLLAGAERVEGTLFGNGERTGNVDLVTLALNMYAQGVDPKLNFENLPYLETMYSYFTGQRVSARHPYTGELVFAAFSGSHQDAIAKGMRWREEHGGVWDVPYLPIDPKDIGRVYEGEIIRINSQSGKGGVGYVLESVYKLRLPTQLKDKFVKIVKKISETEHRELKPTDIYELFLNTYLRNEKYFSLSEVDYRLTDGIDAEVLLKDNQKETTARLLGHGNGRLDAVSNILKNYFGIAYKMNAYEQQALMEKAGTSSKAITYINIEAEGKAVWGVGVHDDSNSSSVRALCAALNNFFFKRDNKEA